MCDVCVAVATPSNCDTFSPERMLPHLFAGLGGRVAPGAALDAFLSARVTLHWSARETQLLV